jgi:hypothetical protein
LIYNYENAIEKRYRNPWFVTISRYNGGNKNIKYYKRIIKNMKIIRRLKRKGRL